MVKVLNPDWTHEEVKEFFVYDGEFLRWAKKPSKKICVGDLAGSLSKGRLVISFRKQRCATARLIWFYVNGKWPENLVDHIDGNPMNDRIENLRDITNQMNIHNVHRANKNNRSTGIIGVSKYARTGKFLAQIRANKVHYHLGFFDTVEEASNAYLNAKRKLHSGCTL